MTGERRRIVDALRLAMREDVEWFGYPPGTVWTLLRRARTAVGTCVVCP